MIERAREIYRNRMALDSSSSAYPTWEDFAIALEESRDKGICDKLDDIASALMESGPLAEISKHLDSIATSLSRMESRQ